MTPAADPPAVAKPVPVGPREDTHAIVRAAVEEAMAPLRLRLDAIERRSLEALARVTTPPPPRPEPRLEVPAPPTLPPLIADFTVERDTPAAAPPDDGAWTRGVETWLDADRRRRRLLLVIAGGVIVALPLLCGVLAACS